MRNFYLFEEALQVATIIELEEGLNNLNKVIINRDSKKDSFICNPNIWECEIKQGYIYDLFGGIVNMELQRVVPFIFSSFLPQEAIFENHVEIDDHFPDDYNAFTGFNFSQTSILKDRQVFDVSSYNQFIDSCTKSEAYSSILNFWEYKEAIFSNLIFCDRVWDQIRHLSVTDDRFKLIIDKLECLNDYTGRWKEGGFDYDNCGLDCAPDTQKRINDTLQLRTFTCPTIGNKVFSLHIRWSFGREPFRLYFYPDANSHKVYVGYIGAKKEIGF